MRMLYDGVTKLDKIRNERIRNKRDNESGENHTKKVQERRLK